MTEEVFYTVAAYGSVDGATKSWRKWLSAATELAHSNGYQITHLELQGESFKGSKMLTFSRARARLDAALDRKERLEWVGLYDLPPGFGTAAFDFRFVADRSRFGNYAAVTFDRLIETTERRRIAEMLKQHVVHERGEVFRLGRDEFRTGYLCRLKPAKEFRSLRVLSRF